MLEHRFGGPWTEKKLTALRDYLNEYRKIFSKSPSASKLKTIYVDAFAGTGDRTEPCTADTTQLDALSDAQEIAHIKSGSARIALELSSPFDEYVFIERKEAHATQLRAVIATDYSALQPRCKVVRANANDVLREFAQFRDWKNQRAVVFLDPYGMSIDWVTIRLLAETRAVDLWVLLPLGNAVMRLLTRKRPPSASWSRKLSFFFGENDWKDRFYKLSGQGQLFDGDAEHVKVATFEMVGAYFLERLATVFAGVAPHAMPLINNRGNALFLLCFAAANKRGAPIAIRIAGHLLKR